MTRRVFALFLLLSIVSVPAILPAASKKRVARKKAKRKPAKKPLAPATIIADVSVIDVLSGTITPHQDLLLRGETISEIRNAVAREKTVRYIMPGLWDMHVHLWHAKPQFDEYLAHGVTGLRNMGADLKQVRKWQGEIARGELVGPRIYTSGAAITAAPGEDGSRLPVVVVRNPIDARHAFDKFYEQEVNFIKIIDIPADAYEALAEASRHDGVPIAGHLPNSVSAFTAAQDRMSSMEHLFGIALACSTKEDALRKRLLAADPNDSPAAIKTEILDTYDPDIARRLFAEFRTYNVRQTPTLTFWSRLMQAAGQGDKTLLQREYDNAFRLTGTMAKAGVPILAGTDTGDPMTVPGVELHKELALLVKAGLTPAQALRAATSEPAAMMRKASEWGQVRQGFAGDLVVLTANPLLDIANTRKIQSVYLRGKKLSR